MRHPLNLFTFIMVLGFAAGANAATWHVVPGGGGDATTIQAGINLASNGDVVMVASGTYTGAGNVNVNFNGKNITVISESSAQFTTIDCQNAAAAFVFNQNETSAAVVQGFTIKNGSGVKGGGISIDSSSPTITYNVFSHCNATTAGGAIYAKFGNPTVYNNTFDNNGAPFGGAMCFAAQSNTHFYQNIICNSTAGGAYFCSGAGNGTVVACNDAYANVGGDTICKGDAGQNFSLDPLFCGVPGSDNFFLQQTSPCSSAFSPCATGVGVFGVLCQVTATEPITWGKVKSMYR
jgi:hypothetical protein